jgi:hypothetical protein
MPSQERLTVCVSRAATREAEDEEEDVFGTYLAVSPQH